MNTGVYDYIEMDQVLASVKGDIGIMGEVVYDPSIERWINDAVAQVDACDFYVKKPCCLELDCGRAKLPKGFRKLLGVRFKKNTILVSNTGDYTVPNVAGLKLLNTTSTTVFVNGTTVLVETIGIFTFSRSSTATANDTTIVQPTTGSGRWILTITNSQITEAKSTNDISCNEIIYVDQVFASDCGCNANTRNFRSFLTTCEIIDGYIHFKNMPASVDEIEISYMGIPISDECLYFIPPDYERALSAYARMMFYDAYPEVKGPAVSAASWSRAEALWSAQKGILRGKAAKRSFDDNKYMIRAIYNAWFVRLNKIWS